MHSSITPYKYAHAHEAACLTFLHRVRLDDDDEGVPSSALREICLLKVGFPLNHLHPFLLKEIV